MTSTGALVGSTTKGLPKYVLPCVAELLATDAADAEAALPKHAALRRRLGLRVLAVARQGTS